MFPNPQNQAGQPQGGTNGLDLEERLRGLILNNAPVKNTEIHIPSSPSTINANPPTLPPHMRKASQADQQHYIDNLIANTGKTQKPSTTVPESHQSGGRKRMNQAQRRQMSSQMSIAVDTRQHRQLGGSPNSFTPYSGQHQQTWSPSHLNNNPRFQTQQRFQHQQQHSPHLAQPSAASPFTPQAHYQKFSHSGVYSQQVNPNYQTQRTAFSSQPQSLHTTNQAGPGPNAFAPRPSLQNRQLYHPGSPGGQGRARQFGPNLEEMVSQSTYLEKLVQDCVPKVKIDIDEANEKEGFRALIEKACREAIFEHEQQELGNVEFEASSVELKCYGSLSSGFATKGSDMDLALLTPFSTPSAESPESPIPRLLEKKLLSLGYGARLLTRTRVPIIKLCQHPTEKLMADLLEERRKWESGFTEVDEKQVESPTTEHAEPTLKPDDPDLAPNAETSCVSDNAQPQRKKPITLRQKEHQSLSDYCGSAKRLLRKHGGRDLSANTPELNLEESKLLNDVCRSFILGLTSEELSQRLCAYGSIAPLFDPSVSFVQRSLNGICTQVEGESLAMGWEKRPLLEATDKHESESRASLEAWKLLQEKSRALTESDIYDRHLHTALDKLKRSHSLQLVFLEQMQYESPHEYLLRVQRLKDDLEGKKLPKEFLRKRELTGGEFSNLFVVRYIAGIHNPQIRERMQSLEGIATLKEAARKHQILQLVKDYEHALEVKLYDEQELPHVERYIALLKELVEGRSLDGCDHNHAPLISRMRALADPTHISQDKARDRYKDHLEFPKNSVGIQCDINFSNNLALHNTLLLRLYSVCDPRVKSMVLFVKHWAKTRGINTPYRGTLGSYGYVLMVLHYLVNIVHPPVCPNLQHMHKDPSPHLPLAQQKAQTTCDGRDVRFWRNEAEIRSLADRRMLTQNQDCVGVLLRGFFEYFAQSGQMTTVRGQRGFDWGRDVLSLRTKHGILSKQEKGWVGARTVVETTQVAAPSAPSSNLGSTNLASAAMLDGEGTGVETPESDIKSAKQPMKTIEEIKEVRHRYLFAIEDPFEIDHNIARTVAHHGIVAIREEFRRAWGIIKAVGTKFGPEEELLQPAPGANESKAGLKNVLDMIHGPEATSATHKTS